MRAVCVKYNFPPYFKIVNVYLYFFCSILHILNIIFLDSLVSLVSRLENSYNIESVLEPIDIKISEAIMNFQENGAAISKKVCLFFHIF